jgi:hypothetical protein
MQVNPFKERGLKFKYASIVISGDQPTELRGK